MENQELNTKLIKWRWPDADFVFYEWGECSVAPVLPPKNLSIIKFKSFTISVDSCLKWLVPEFPYFEMYNCPLGYKVEMSLDMKHHAKKINSNPALAIAEVCGQLIDDASK